MNDKKIIWTALPYATSKVYAHSGAAVVGAIEWYCPCTSGDQAHVEDKFIFYLGISPKESADPHETMEAVGLDDAELWLSTMLAAVRAAKKVEE